MELAVVDHRVEELNARIGNRLFPSSSISGGGVNPRLFRPVPLQTKYELFPIIMKRGDDSVLVGAAAADIDATNRVTYSLASGSPDIRNPPDFASKIDTETKLRNQYFALQRGGVADQSTYIPNSHSDLYFRDLEDSGILGKDRDRTAILAASSRGGGGRPNNLAGVASRVELRKEFVFQ